MGHLVRPHHDLLDGAEVIKEGDYGARWPARVVFTQPGQASPGRVGLDTDSKDAKAMRQLI
jgi:hypothetical protein